MSSPRPPKDRRVRTATVHASRRRLHLAGMVLALLLITVLAASANAPPDIDTFANPASAAVYTVTAGNTNFSSMQSPSTGVDILGDWRDVYVYSVAGNSVNLEVGDTKFRHSQNSGGTARTVLTYDGNGGGYGGAGTIYNGLGGKDLTYGGTRNGFRFRIVSLDWTTDVRIKVYDNANSGKYSEKTFSGLFPGNSTNADIVVEFAAIPQGSGATGPATFSSVGAIEFEFIGSHIDTDLTLDSIDTTILDWGDLPQDGSGCSNYPYATRLACDGPRHLVSSGLYLGASIDPSASSAGELDGQPSAVADGDDVHHGDDENGVVPQAASGKGSCEYWNSATNGGKLRFTGTGSGRLVGWVDFDGDGFEAAETVVNQLVSGAPWSPIDIEFNIPSGVFSGQCEASLYARFRLFPPDDESSLNDLRAP